MPTAALLGRTKFAGYFLALRQYICDFVVADKVCISLQKEFCVPKRARKPLVFTEAIPLENAKELDHFANGVADYSLPPWGAMRSRINLGGRILDDTVAGVSNPRSPAPKA